MRQRGRTPLREKGHEPCAFSTKRPAYKNHARIGAWGFAEGSGRYNNRNTQKDGRCLALASGGFDLADNLEGCPGGENLSL